MPSPVDTAGDGPGYCEYQSRARQEAVTVSDTGDL